MSTTEPLEREEAETRYEALTRLGRRRRRIRRAAQVGGAALSVAAIIAVALWAGSALLGMRERSEETPAAPDAVPVLAAGIRSTCATTAAGELACWGANSQGQLGDGSEEFRTAPVLVRGLSNVTDVAPGFTHTCAVAEDGAAFCWGGNGFGALGNGTHRDSAEPVPVEGLSAGVETVAAGSEYSCALTSAGAVQCWGWPERLANILEATSPVLVGGLGSGVVALSGGDQHACVLMSAGDVKCWGINFYGHLGVGNTDRLYGVRDVKVLGSDVVQVSAGGDHTCALLRDGTAWCWGLNTNGQVGDGSRTDRDKPVEVLGLPLGIVEIDAGGNHTCALADDGSVWCWGSQRFGQLGDATAARSSTPVQVGGLAEVTDIAVGGDHACAAERDGSIRCWGNNRSGQLGDGTEQANAVPVLVSLPVPATATPATAS